MNAQVTIANLRRGNLSYRKEHNNKTDTPSRKCPFCLSNVSCGLRAYRHIVRGVFQRRSGVLLDLQLRHLATVPLRQAGGAHIKGQTVDVTVFTQRSRL